MAVMDIIIKATDQASQVIENIGKKGSEAGAWLEKNWVAVGAATTAAGVGLEAVARAQAPLTEQTRKLAASLGMTEKETRSLALGLANVTLGIDDAVATMEIGRQQGIKSAEGLERFTQFWDLVADATGEAITTLADGGTALRVMGIAAGDESEALAALGFVQRETTGTVGEFLQMLQRVGPDLADMGMSIDDTAAVLGILEREMGLTGRVARTELMQAMRDAEGDMSKLFQTLGITAEQFDTYRAKVAASSGVIEENAAIHAQSYTLMQHLQHAASELTYQYGDLIGMVGNLSPLMMSLGPVLGGVMKAKELLAGVTLKTLVPSIKASTAAAWKFTAALLANPITWVVVGIMALIAALIYLWKNWDQVSKWMAGAWEWLRERIAGVLTFLQGLPERFQEILSSMVDRIAEWRATIIARIGEVARNIWNAIVNTLAGLPARLLSLGGDMISSLISGITGAIGRISGAVDTVKGVLNRLNPFARSSPSLVEQVMAGVAAIQREYARLENIGDMQLPGVPALPTPQLAMAGASPTGAGTIMNITGPLVVVQNMVVRSDADIENVSRQLHRHIQAGSRARGGR